MNLYSPRNFQDMNSSAACGIEKNDESVPAYYRAAFTLDKVADTFLNMESWGKGMVWVNGHAMGRFLGNRSSTNPVHARLLAEKRSE